jgi:hypothetical protein
LDYSPGDGDPERGILEKGAGKIWSRFPRTPACYGFTIIAKVRAGREDAVREYANTIEKEYGEYPYVTADEIKKALRLKKAFADALDQMQ